MLATHGNGKNVSKISGRSSNWSHLAMQGKGVPPTHIAPRRSPEPHTYFQHTHLCFENLCWLLLWKSLLWKPLLRKRPLSHSISAHAKPPRSQKHRGSQRHCKLKSAFKIVSAVLLLRIISSAYFFLLNFGVQVLRRTWPSWDLPRKRLSRGFVHSQPSWNCQWKTQYVLPLN